jgi:4-hydroxybenzoate polyprenyltransferase
MDEQLERWAAAWQKQEIQEMQLLSRARKVHRTEASLLTAYTAWWLFGAVTLLVGVMQFALWTKLGWHAWFAAGALVIGGIILARDLRASMRTRAQLVETPLDLVSDMLLVHERELRGWTGRPALAFSIVCALVLLTRTAQQQAWGLLAVVCIALGALTYIGIKRTRYLRRELAVLRELRSELE